MESKYYTPTIEEFHVGFEFEYQNGVDKNSEDVWKKTICTKADFRYLDKATIKDLRRVKYLDQEDIESLGFEFIKETGINEKLDFFKRKQFKSNNYRIQWFKNGSIMISSNNNDLEDEFKGHPDRLRFEGTIKNKSELKRVIKMFGYGHGN